MVIASITGGFYPQLQSLLPHSSTMSRNCLRILYPVNHGLHQLQRLTPYQKQALSYGETVIWYQEPIFQGRKLSPEYYRHQAPIKYTAMPALCVHD